MSTHRSRERVGTRVSTWMPAGTAAYDTLILSDSPLGYWKLIETSGVSGIVADSSGNGRNGTLGTVTVTYPAPTFSVSGPSNTLTKGLQYNPTVSAGSSTAATWSAPGNVGAWPTITGDGAYTWEAWIYFSSGGNGVYPLVLAAAGGGHYLNLDSTAGALTTYGNKLFFQYPNSIDGSSSYFYGSTTNGVLSAATWYHVAFTAAASNGTMNLYVNGVSVATASGLRNSGNLISNSASYGFGPSNTVSGQSANVFNGKQTAVAFYNKTLSAATILSHYNMGIL